MPNILTVDDYSVTQRVLGHILQHGGHTTYAAETALEALEVLEKTEIDLIVLDIAMPGMDGITLLRQLKSDERYAHIPIIMLTASGQDGDRVDSEEAGADDFLTKPIGSSDLMNAVERLLG
jgi:CheY-like chemotaxis protein